MPLRAIQDQQGAEVGPPFAYHQHLFKQGISGNGSLHIHGRYLFAVGEYNNVLEPTGDVNVLLFNARLVATVQPAVTVDQSGTRLRLLPVPHAHAGAANQQLVVGADAQFHVAQRDADAGGIVVVEEIDTDYRTGFGKAVALQQRHAETNEHLRHTAGQRRSAANGGSQASTQLRPDFARHENIEYWPKQFG